MKKRWYTAIEPFGIMLCLILAKQGSAVQIIRDSGRFHAEPFIMLEVDMGVMPGTLILMADGMARSIENIRVGDLVIGRKRKDRFYYFKETEVVEIRSMEST